MSVCLYIRICNDVSTLHTKCSLGQLNNVWNRVSDIGCGGYAVFFQNRQFQTLPHYEANGHM